VRCARFKGITKVEFIDQLNIQGSILQAIEEVSKFIRRNTKMSSEFTGAMTRKDIHEYPTAGIREALINALVHANYEILGTRIFIAIYDNRLEIQNPGIMPPGMSIEQFKEGVSRIRNPVIARVFSELGLIEEWGSGYKRIQAACQKDHYPEPKWEEMGTVLRVTFFPYGTKLGLSWDQVGTKSKAFCPS
jgi:ATP-dependent DNA helicase RecG